MRRNRLILNFTLIALCLLTFSLPAQAADPVRIVALSRYSESVEEAKNLFDKKFGAGLIEVEVGESEIAPEKLARADVIVFHYLSGAIYERYASQVKAAAARGAIVLGIPGDNAERFWKVKADAKLLAWAEQFWTYGGVENLAGFLALLYRAAGGAKPIEVPPPQPQAATGIYHPRAAKAFATLPEYLAWYRARKIVPPDAPFAAITFYSNNHKFGDLAHLDALIAQLEREGIGAIAAFGWPLKNQRALLMDKEQSSVRVILAMNLGFSKPDDAEELQRYGAPVINLMTTRESVGEWIASPKGITPDRLPTQLNAPERAGANEPLMIAATEKVEGSTTTRSQAVPERVEMAVKRVRRWLALQTKANAGKRVAFIYYSNPPGKGYLGASYLNLMPSLLALMERLKAEGYQAGDTPPDEKQLIEMLHRSGRNIEEWAPGELDEMSRQSMTLLPVSKYRSWYKDLPAEFRAEVEKVWGPPEKSNLMTIRQRDGQPAFVLPGVRLGNLFLGPQPLRSTFDRATKVQHDVLTPPPHSYIAAYLWYRNEFKADAVVHMGRHGTLEWLPGKHVGQAGWDASEALLGDLPDPYYFIIDGGGEAIQARRRAAGVMIGHLTPMIVPGGEQPEYEALHQALDGYEKTAETSPQLAEEYKRQALARIRALKLDKQLGLDLEKLEWEETFEAVHDFLHDVESGPTPMGQATIGSLPRAEIQREALEEFLRSAFRDQDLKAVQPHLKPWADALFEGKSPPASSAFAPKLREKATATINEGRTWLSNLRRSPGMELDALVGILNGRYHASGLLGDPLRNPASIPSGRNLHDFDTNLIPTKAAWELGKMMSDQTLARFKAETGRFPEKVSFVLWYGETGRSHGATESEAMYLMGVEPKWNARGVVDGLRLIPDAELKRPRVDVVFTISGIYRDGFGDKLLWLDRAARLAASADDSNALRRHDREIAEQLKQSGVAAALAEKAAQARVFGSAPGMYGVGGVGQIIEQSLDEGKEKGLAEMYLHHMNHAYSEKLWGDEVPRALDQQLKGNQAVIHSRTTFVYGLLDNDDSYQFAGGLNIATKSVNGGEPPQFYINNQRSRSKEQVESFRTFLVKELSTRYWNPKWIRAQQEAGYAGARQFVKEIEHLYGWQATSGEHVDGQLWQKSFDVYVADKHGLAMDEFFEQANPHARQWQLSRMLEVDHQGTYKFSDADRGELIKRYVRSVIAHGAACSANTCENRKLHEYIAAQAPMVAGLGDAELQAFAARMAKATRWNARDFAAAPAAFRSGLAQGLGQQASASAPAAGGRAAMNRKAGATDQSVVNSANTQPALPNVSGFTMEEKVISKTGEAIRSLPSNPFIYVPILALVLGGLLWERRRRAI